MKTFKKISAWLAMLSLTASILPSAALGTEAGYVHLEAESGTYDSEIVSEKTNQNAFGGKLLQTSKEGQTADIKWTFDVPQTGEYDVWILMSEYGSTSGKGWLSRIQTAFKDEELAFNEATVMTSSRYEQWVSNQGYTDKMCWSKVRSKVALDEGENTLTYYMPLATSSEYTLNNIDCVYIVPTNWNWAPANSSSSWLTEDIPYNNITEYVYLEAENGTYDSTMFSVKSESKFFGGKLLQTSANGITPDIKWTFNVPKMGEYDLWILMSQYGSTSDKGWLSRIQTAFNGEELAFNEATDMSTIRYDAWVSNQGYSDQLCWTKVRSFVSLDEGENSLTYYTPTATSSGMTLNNIDCLYIVPSGWGWTPSESTESYLTNDIPSKHFFEADANGVFWMEGENSIAASSFTVRNTENASGGKDLYLDTTASEGEYVTATFNFNIDNAAAYDIWFLGNKQNTSYLSKVNYKLDNEEAYTEVGVRTAGYTANSEMPIEYESFCWGSAQPTYWNRLEVSKKLSEGEHSITIGFPVITLDSVSIRAQLDCIAVVPASMNWTPKGTSKPQEALKGYAWIEGEASNNEADVKIKTYDMISDRDSYKILSNRAFLHNGQGSVPKYNIEPTQSQKFDYSFELANDGKYDVFILASNVNAGSFAKLYADIDNTADSIVNEAYRQSASEKSEAFIDQNGEEFNSFAVKLYWQKIMSEKEISAGKHTLNTEWAMSDTGYYFFGLDNVIIVPSNWGFTLPTGSDKPGDVAVMLDSYEQYFHLSDTYADGLTENITGLDKVGSAGSKFTYETTNANAITNDGTVTRPPYGQNDVVVPFNITASRHYLADGYEFVSDTQQAYLYVLAYASRVEYTDINVAYSDGGMIIDELIAGKTVTAKTDILKNVDTDENAVLIAALYENGVLVKADFDSKALTKQAQTFKAEIAVPESVDMSVYEVKVFLWKDLNRLEPIASSISVPNEDPIYEAKLLDELEVNYNSKNISGFTMGVIADVQTSALEGYETYLHHYGSLVKASKRIEMDCLADLGDMVMGSTADKAGELAVMAAQTEKMEESGLPIFRVKGNHDDNRWGVVNNQNAELFITDDEWIEACSADWANVMDGSTAGNKTYYYKDFAEDKIRVVALDVMNIPYTYNAGDALLYEFGFAQAQLDWLANEALDFTEKADKDEWGVVFVMHTGVFDAANVYNYSSFGAIVKAFQNGTSGTINVENDIVPIENLTYDFTSQGSMETICVLDGHTHKDGFTAYYYDMPKITVTCSMAGGEGRELYTENEDAWDIVTIDRTARKIYCTRFGAGSDREFSY